MRRLIVASLLLTVPAGAQSVLERPPNLLGTWVGPVGTLHFNFLHRFRSSDTPENKVANSPTFLVALGLPLRALVGFQYATNSQVVARYPNEWELFGRLAPWTEERGAPLDVALHGAYNLAAQSVDGELTLGRHTGRLRLLVAGRALSNAFDSGDVRLGAAGGATLQLARHVALAGDVASLLDRNSGERVAWSAGVQLAIPYTPHTLSLHAANTLTSTIHGASRGTDLVRYGFEFTIPVTLRRYVGQRSRRTIVTDTARGAADTTNIAMRQLSFPKGNLEIAAGTTVAWKNEDPVPHTVTADDGSWDSGLIDPGATWFRTFSRAGTYSFHCTPHPFMKGTVVVR